MRKADAVAAVFDGLSDIAKRRSFKLQPYFREFQIGRARGDRHLSAFTGGRLREERKRVAERLFGVTFLGKAEPQSAILRPAQASQLCHMSPSMEVTRSPQRSTASPRSLHFVSQPLSRFVFLAAGHWMSLTFAHNSDLPDAFYGRLELQWV